MTMRSIILATIAAALSASLALAVPLRFENPEGPDRIAWENFFVDITKPASEQPGDLLFSVRNAVNFTKDKAITIMFSISPTGSVRLLGESSLLTPMEFGELIGPGGLTPNMAGGGLFTTTIAPGGDLSTEFRFPLGRRQHIQPVRLRGAPFRLVFLRLLRRPGRYPRRRPPRLGLRDRARCPRRRGRAGARRRGGFRHRRRGVLSAPASLTPTRSRFDVDGEPSRSSRSREGSLRMAACADASRSQRRPS